MKNRGEWPAGELRVKGTAWLLHGFRAAISYWRVWRGGKWFICLGKERESLGRFFSGFLTSDTVEEPWTHYLALHFVCWCRRVRSWINLQSTWRVPKLFIFLKIHLGFSRMSPLHSTHAFISLRTKCCHHMVPTESACRPANRIPQICLTTSKHTGRQAIT